MVVLRAATWIVVPDLVAAASLGSLALARGTSFGRVLSGLLGYVARLPAAPLLVASPLRSRARQGSWERITPALRRAAIGAGLLAIFGGLFASADRAFAHLAGEALDVNVDASLLPYRIAVFTLFVLLTGALAAVGLRHSPGDLFEDRSTSASAPRFELSRTEWTIALASLDGLFAAFVAIQITVLFGGHEFVLQTAGLTYAEYARQGFFQLLVTAGLVLSVVAVAVRLARVEGRGDWLLLRALLGVLCVLTLVILASAHTRLGLYEQAFGFTRTRLTAHAVILWLAAVFVLVLVTGALRRGEALPHATVVTGALALVLFSAADPDALVAERNVARFERTGDVDLAYLSTLSADAVPALAELPPRRAGCVLAAIEPRVGSIVAWPAFNVSRARALEVLEDVPSASECYSFIWSAPGARPPRTSEAG